MTQKSSQLGHQRDRRTGGGRSSSVSGGRTREEGGGRGITSRADQLRGDLGDDVAAAQQHLVLAGGASSCWRPGPLQPTHIVHMVVKVWYWFPTTLSSSFMPET